MLDTLKGELRIFTKEVEKADGTKRIIFNTCMGYSKDDNGYINYYMPVNFATALKKDVAKVYKNESFDILLKEGWIKAYKDKDNFTRPILFVNKATIITNDTKKPVKKAKTKELEPIDDDSLPF